MDLYAFAQIEDLQHYLDDNNIDIPRLRGLRLMKDEKIITDEETEKSVKGDQIDYAVHWLREHCDWCWSSWKMDRKHKAFIYGKDEHGNKAVVGIDLSKVHGKDKKRIKFHWKQIKKRYYEQFGMFNKYVGKNVLYVHARLGSTNWSDYKVDTTHPMYLERIDDAWDGTYCDIYYDLDKAVNKDEVQVH